MSGAVSRLPFASTRRGASKTRTNFHYRTMRMLQTSLIVLLLLLIKVQGQLVGGRGKIILEAYTADRTKLLGAIINDMVIDLASTPSINIKATAKFASPLARASSMSFYVDQVFVRTDSTIPSWMAGSKEMAWSPTVGTHKVRLTVHRRKRGNGRPVLDMVVQIVVINSSTMAPVVAPANAQPSAKANAPVSSPTSAPMLQPLTIPTPVIPPSSAPRATPPVSVTAVYVPTHPPAMTGVSTNAPIWQPFTRRPTAAPVSNSPSSRSPSAPMASAPVFAAPVTRPPTLQPRTVPTRNPTRKPTKVPTRRPTKAPSPAPTPCTSDIVKFINQITLSNQTLSVSGFTPLDEALLQLVASNPKAGVRLSTCVEADKKRLTQRFAYLALIFTLGQGGNTTWFDDADECKWDGVQCNGNGEVSTLDRSGVGLRGSIPADVGLWTNLSSFEISYNQLTGTLPTSIGSWPRLTAFKVDENKLAGALPTAIGLWTKLTTFDVGSNQFNGTLPSNIGAWTGLTYIDVYRNSFNGQLPSSIGAWTDVKYFDVNRNQLTGRLPSSMGNWTNVDTMYLFENKFSGRLFTFIRAWTKLKEFDVDDNLFTGTIPLGVSRWTVIQEAYFTTTDSMELCLRSLVVLSARRMDLGS
jgi:hypothetical protein